LELANDDVGILKEAMRASPWPVTTNEHAIGYASAVRADDSNECYDYYKNEMRLVSYENNV
jgi:hypothetical protein